VKTSNLTYRMRYYPKHSVTFLWKTDPGIVFLTFINILCSVSKRLPAVTVRYDGEIELQL
jgi:hypothetical protein